jgi:hypothetical protein
VALEDDPLAGVQVDGRTIPPGRESTLARALL